MNLALVISKAEALQAEGVGINIDRQSQRNDQQKTSTKHIFGFPCHQVLLLTVQRYNLMVKKVEVLPSDIFKPDFVQADGISNNGNNFQPDEWSLADSQDGLYNPEKAKAEFAEKPFKQKEFSSNPFGCCQFGEWCSHLNRESACCT